MSRFCTQRLVRQSQCRRPSQCQRGHLGLVPRWLRPDGDGQRGRPVQRHDDRSSRHPREPNGSDPCSDPGLCAPPQSVHEQGGSHLFALLLFARPDPVDLVDQPLPRIVRKSIAPPARPSSQQTLRWRETDSNFWFRAGGSARRAVWARDGLTIVFPRRKASRPACYSIDQLQNELFLRDVAALETAIGGDRSAMEPKLLRSCQLRDGVPGRATFKPAQ